MAPPPHADRGTNAHSPYRRDIDGLRAVAVLAVVAFHAVPGIAPGGFAGVDVFFVISGFLISGLIRSELAGGGFTIPGVQRTLQALHAAGVAKVIVIGPAPQWVDSLPRVLLDAAWRDPAHDLPQRTRLGLVPEIAQVDAAMAAAFSPEYVSAWRVFCDDPDGCVTSSDDGVFSWDYGHLTAPGATYLARALIACGALSP